MKNKVHGSIIPGCQLSSPSKMVEKRLLKENINTLTWYLHNYMRLICSTVWVLPCILDLKKICRAVYFCKRRITNISR